MTSKERAKNWTKKQCVQLIREFRKRPEMWDQKHRLYYNKIAKRNGWREIGAALNISAERCKFKMNTVMSGFRREKAKFLHDYFRRNSGEIILCILLCRKYTSLKHGTEDGICVVLRRVRGCFFVCLYKPMFLITHYLLRRKFMTFVMNFLKNVNFALYLFLCLPTSLIHM